MEYTQIAFDVADRVATITLDRPDRLNAFTNQMMHELVDAFDRADRDDDVRAVVVTGRGRGFCAGADLGEGADTFSRGGSDIQTSAGVPRDGGGLVSLRIFRSLKPVIGAINGPAVGVGITMTLPMDVRLASESARIGFVFARRGIVPEAASSWFLPRLVGIQQAAEWVFTGRVFSAEEALAGRLVRSVHPPDELLPAAYALAAEIADNTALGQRGAVPPDDVADARSEPPDGRPPRRLPRDPVPRPQRRHPRGRGQLPGEAAAGVPRPRQRRPAGPLPGLGRPRLRLIRFFVAVLRCASAGSYSLRSAMPRAALRCARQSADAPSPLRFGRLLLASLGNASGHAAVT